MSDPTWLCLAAGRGRRLRPITDDRPKALVAVHDKPLVGWLEATVRAVGIDDLVAVTGYRGDMLAAREGLRTYRNPDYDETDMVRSLWCAQAALDGTTVISYSDILYTTAVLESVLQSPHDVAVAVDTDWRAYWDRRHDDPIEDAESLRIGDDDRITSIGQPIDAMETPEAQYVGLVKCSPTGVADLRTAYEHAATVDAEGDTPFDSGRSLDELHMTDLLQGMIDLGMDVHAVPIEGQWVEIDTPNDLEIATTVCTPREDGTLTIDRSTGGVDR